MAGIVAGACLSESVFTAPLTGTLSCGSARLPRELADCRASQDTGQPEEGGTCCTPVEGRRVEPFRPTGASCVSSSRIAFGGSRCVASACMARGLRFCFPRLTRRHQSLLRQRGPLYVCKRHFRAAAGIPRGSTAYLYRHSRAVLADEIQSGLGRCGTTFACQREDVVPDVCMLGKALAGGIVPLSAVLSRNDVLGVITPGSHGSTFGGNPLAVALGHAVVGLLETGEFQERAGVLGERLRSRLEPLVGSRGSPRFAL
jgi:hypothetical protein